MKKQNYGGTKKSDLKAKANSSANRKGGNNFQNYHKPQAPLPKLPLIYVDSMTVSDISQVTKRTPADIIKALMEMGILANQNQSIDRDTAELLADALHIEHQDDSSLNHKRKYATIAPGNDLSQHMRSMAFRRNKKTYNHTTGR